MHALLSAWAAIQNPTVMWEALSYVLNNFSVSTTLKITRITAHSPKHCLALERGISATWLWSKVSEPLLESRNAIKKRTQGEEQIEIERGNTYSIIVSLHFNRPSHRYSTEIPTQRSADTRLRLSWLNKCETLMAQGTTKAADSRGFKPHQWYFVQPETIESCIHFFSFLLEQRLKPWWSARWCKNLRVVCPELLLSNAA